MRSSSSLPSTVLAVIVGIVAFNCLHSSAAAVVAGVGTETEDHKGAEISSDNDAIIQLLLQQAKPFAQLPADNTDDDSSILTDPIQLQQLQQQLLQQSPVLPSLTNNNNSAASFSGVDYSKLNNEQLLQVLIQILLPHKAHLQEAFRLQEESSSPALTCQLCTGLVPLASYLAKNVITPVAKWIVVQACELLDLAPRDSICTPIIDSYAEQILYILRNPRDENRGTELCGILFTECETMFPDLIDWKVNVVGGKPALAEESTQISPDASYTTFIQFTDIHLDLDYEVGSSAQCGNGVPICCREGEEWPGNGEGRAGGVFGDMNCALPDTAFQASLVDAKNRFQNAEYIFLTGDYIHSGVWLYSLEENERVISHVVKSVAEVFPNGNVYPITGNHETNVVNMYVPPELWDKGGSFNLTWLYRSILDPFITAHPDLLDEAEINRFYQWGYYTAQPETGLRFVFLNTNFCYDGNFWLGYAAGDIGGQLQWLAEVLKQAEDAKEAVYIIGHVEPGNCFGHWSGEFNRILARFEGTVRAGFYGHSHKPQYRVHFSKNATSETVEPLRPISIIAGSLLTDGMNPAYSAYRVDGAEAPKTWDLLRHELVILKLDESNSNNGGGGAKFEKLIDSYDDFGLEDFRGETVLKLGKRMICDQELLDAYLKFHHKGTNSFSHSPCNIEDQNCKTSLLTDFVVTNAEDRSAVEYFQNFIKFTDCGGSGGSAHGIGLGGWNWVVAINSVLAAYLLLVFY